jgi:hypothetical protein
MDGNIASDTGDAGAAALAECAPSNSNHGLSGVIHCQKQKRPGLVKIMVVKRKT